MSEDGRMYGALKTSLCLIFSLISGAATAGIIIGENKIYFSGKKDFVDVRVRNPSEENYLLVSRVVSEESRHNIESAVQEKNFIVTPPAVSLKAGKERILRIAKADIKSLPGNRESMHFLSVTSIPEDKTAENSVQIAVRTWIRLIYRPENLIKNKKLEYNLEKNGSEVKFNNKSPFYLFFSGVEFNRNTVTGLKVIPPFGNAIIGECFERCDISYELLNDDGSIGQKEKLSL
ncbi:TPA: molecular chaperone [Enterobacter asburiae]|nr:molecular chaperone [Enterobacter asburiae]